MIRITKVAPMLLRPQRAKALSVLPRKRLCLAYYRAFSDWTEDHVKQGEDKVKRSFEEVTAKYSLGIPHQVRHKVVSEQDAVSLISNGDTICVSGFVGQASPELILAAVRKRYENTGEPNKLTLLFGGGPGDGESKGLNWLAGTESKAHGDATNPDKSTEHHPPMLRRTIG